MKYLEYFKIFEWNVDEMSYLKDIFQELIDDEYNITIYDAASDRGKTLIDNFSKYPKRYIICKIYKPFDNKEYIADSFNIKEVSDFVISSIDYMGSVGYRLFRTEMCRQDEDIYGEYDWDNIPNDVDMCNFISLIYVNKG